MKLNDFKMNANGQNQPPLEFKAVLTKKICISNSESGFSLIINVTPGLKSF